jgi:hypothetical protein
VIIDHVEADQTVRRRTIEHGLQRRLEIHAGGGWKNTIGGHQPLQAQGPEMFPQNGRDGGGGRLSALLQWHRFRIGGRVMVVARKTAVP